MSAHCELCNCTNGRVILGSEFSQPTRALQSRLEMHTSYQNHNQIRNANLILALQTHVSLSIIVIILFFLACGFLVY